MWPLLWNLLLDISPIFVIISNYKDKNRFSASCELTEWSIRKNILSVVYLNIAKYRHFIHKKVNSENCISNQIEIQNNTLCLG